MAKEIKILTKEQEKFWELAGKETFLREFLSKARAKFDWHIDPVQLGSRLAMAADMRDYPRMLREIDHQEWKNFFVNEARKLKKDIFKA